MAVTSKDLEKEGGDNVISLKGMYKDYFLDYASYVILERAVPSIEDGLKPVQRRILHSLRQMDDGRYHKVANVIGQTMQYHPHGDAAIGGALVKLGQKDLLIDPQGNWGDFRTGDSAAAARYIEARLTKFALEVAFNPQTTEWQTSYDGRNREPIHLPMKFPLLLAQGVDGIAVGLSTKILPHNFIELCKASIKVLEGKRPKLYPDFQTGGLIDIGEYKGGKRGGKVKVRARMALVDKKFIKITELPYGVTTSTLIDSIVKANDKGKIKIKKVTDNTAADVEILIELAPGISPDLTMDALYAFTDCQISISPNTCVIIEDKPHFITVNEALDISTNATKELLKLELEIKLGELQERWHFVSLERIFIEKRIYRDIEEAENWEQVIEAIDKGLKKYISTPSDKAKKSDKRLKLLRDITEEDIIRLTEIKIKRISKYNSFKADELINTIEEGIKQTQHDLKHLIEFAVAYFKRLIDKYGKGRERKTEIASFDAVKPVQVIVANKKLYANYKDGFVGYGLKKDEFIRECSDMDDIIGIRKDNVMMISRIADKVFLGKNLLHADVWKKGDDRTTYNLIYTDGKSGKTKGKRFHVTSITRDKEYDLGKGSKGSKVHYLSANRNGEAEIVTIQLSPGSKAKKKVFDFDFSELAIKGRGSQGNIITKYPVRKITMKEAGKSTLGAQKFWMDEVSGRLNKQGRGKFLGAFDTGDQILAIYKNGNYELTDLQITNRYEAADLMYIGKFVPKAPVGIVYYDGEKGWTMVKRFLIETNTTGQKFKFISEHRSSKVYYATVKKDAHLKYGYKTNNKKVEKELKLDDFVEVKGWKALGNKLMEFKIISSEELGGTLPKGLIDLQSGEVFDLKEGDSNTEVKVKGNVQPKLFEEPKKVTPKKAAAIKPSAKKAAAKKTAPKKPAAKKAAPSKKTTPKAITKKAAAKKSTAKKVSSSKKKKGGNNLKAGDTIEFDL